MTDIIENNAGINEFDEINTTFWIILFTRFNQEFKLSFLVSNHYLSFVLWSRFLIDCE